MSAQVYVMSRDGLVKVGFSDNPERRRSTIGSGIVIEARFPVDKHKEVEAAAHKLLADKRRHGEWFDVTPEQACRAIKEAIQIVEASLIEDLPSGAKSTSIYLTDEQREALDAFKERVGASGRGEAIAIAIAAYGRNEPTQTDVLEWIKRNTKEGA